MSIGPAELARIAALAELDVEPAELEQLARQVDGILEYVGHLADALANPEPPAPAPSEHTAPFRDDVVAPDPLAAPPAEWAPEMAEGFFVVPRLAAMDGG